MVNVLYMSVFARCYPNILTNPHHALHSAVMTCFTSHSTQEIWCSIGSGEIKYADFFLLATGQKVFCVWRQSDTANNVVMRKRMKNVARVRVPKLAIVLC